MTEQTDLSNNYRDKEVHVEARLRTSSETAPAQTVIYTGKFVGVGYFSMIRPETSFITLSDASYVVNAETEETAENVQSTPMVSISLEKILSISLVAGE